MIRVAIYQPVIPQYRLTFFNAIANCSGLDISLHASKTFPGSPDSVDGPFDFKYYEYPASGLIGNRLFWQSGLCLPDELSQGDVAVICANPRMISYIPLVLQAKKRKIGLIFWGHGHTAGANRVTESIRHRLMSFGDVVLLYHDNEIELFQKAVLKKNRIFATNNTIDISDIEAAKIQWTDKRLQKFKNQNGLNDKKLLLFCGRLTYKTQLNILLEAIAILHKDDGSYHLAIIGDGPERANLEGQVNRLNLGKNITWLGSIYDQNALAPWFLSSHYFVYPGAIGLSIFHAFAFELPVITHGNLRNQMPEFRVLEDGKNGMVFVEGDTEALSSTIKHGFNNKVCHETMKEYSLNTVKEKYSFDNMVNNFVHAVMCASKMQINQ
ncbi:MAG: glycosyltransferase family 4 protein [Desulfobacteraceae bacterium]|nr:glycosyltransferase family 4 protein [Desulfobacteraceae bacterium]